MSVVGLLAGVCTTVSFLPQVVRTWRTTSAAQLSWAWLLLFGVGISGWVAYGLMIRDVAITATNSLTLVLISVLAGLKGAPAILGAGRRR